MAGQVDLTVLTRGENRVVKADEFKADEDYFGESPFGPFFKEDSLPQFIRAVEGAEYERTRRRHESYVRWVTAVGAIVAATTGVYNAFFK